MTGVWCVNATKTFRLIEIILEPTLQNDGQGKEIPPFLRQTSCHHEKWDGSDAGGDLLINLPVVDSG